MYGKKNASMYRFHKFLSYIQVNLHESTRRILLIHIHFNNFMEFPQEFCQTRYYMTEMVAKYAAV